MNIEQLVPECSNDVTSIAFDLSDRVPVASGGPVLALARKIGQERSINASCDYNHTAKKVTQGKAWSMSTGAK